MPLTSPSKEYLIRWICNARAVAVAISLTVASSAFAEERVLFSPFSTEPVRDEKSDNVPKAAFAGYDVVTQFPGGVHSRQLGRLAAGDPEHALELKGSSFWFTSEAHRKAFEENPAWYMPPVGGYCLGAMSAERGRLVPGRLTHVFFVPEFHTWAIYGSSRGPRVWARMTPHDRRIAFRNALANYHHWTGEW